MNILSAKYGDEFDSSILVTTDIGTMSVPVDNGNRHYVELINSGVEIAPFV